MQLANVFLTTNLVEEFISSFAKAKDIPMF